MVFHALEEAHQGEVVRERAGGRDDLDEVGCKGLGALVDGVEVLGGLEIVMRDDDSGTSFAEFFESVFGQLLDGFEFDVDKLKARLGGLDQNFKSACGGAFESASVVFGAAGGDDRRSRVFSEPCFELWHGGEGLRQIVEPEFHESAFFKHF